MTQLSFIDECNRCLHSKTVEIMEDFLRIKGDLVHLHSIQVSTTAVLLAESLGYHEPEKIRLAGLLHDLGKVYIPDAILQKNGDLTDREKELIRMHPVIGAEMLYKYGLGEIGEIILYHHERPDGSGYPYGITKVPVESCIIALADVFVALTNYRPYKPPYPLKEALKITLESVGEFFSRKQRETIRRTLTDTRTF